mgnify:CR=1 FL=1
MSGLFRTKFYAHNWNASAIGPIAAWNNELKTASDFMLGTHLPMFILWKEGDNALLFNEAFATIMGETPFDALGCPANEVWAEVWDDIQPYVEEVFKGQSALRENVPFATWASGFTETRVYTLSYTPIWNPAGLVVGVACLCIDTTQKVQASASIKSERDSLFRLFQEAPGFVCILKGSEHRFVFANSAYTRLVGRTVVGLTVADVLPELVSQGFQDLLNAVYSTGERFVASRKPIKFVAEEGADPELRFVNFVYEAMRNEDQEIEGIFVEGYDVTEEVMAEESIRSLRTELIYVSRVSAMGVMASTLAHELNQPLASIMNYAAGVTVALDSSGSDENIRWGVEGIERSAARAGDVIRGLRQMTRRNNPDFSDLNLEDICKDAVLLIKAGGCREVNITCQFTNVTGVVGDLVQLQQVLINLIKNACEAVNGQPRPEVTISTFRSDDEARICVEDNGPGIEPRRLGALFETCISAKPDGMGIGLSICRTIIEAHGGKISVVNKPTGGAAFTVALPVKAKTLAA